MLNEQVKSTIQQAYRQILAGRGLNPRSGQRLMIAEIAKSLASISVISKLEEDEPEQNKEQAPGPICVVEAGTGTGKTLAYVLGTLPLAKYLGKKVVLSTATVALQEQVVLKDLPDIKAHSDLDFSYTLAKGRGRYLCLSRLEGVLQGNASQNALADLFGEQFASPDGVSLDLYQAMLSKLNAGQWQGDRDDWDTLLADAQWRPVTVEHGQCSGQKCSNFGNCCFYQAREQVLKADCVVANHDLVLADLALGGGAILPAPADTIYIFDEAHHLPVKANQHFACFTRLKGSLQWLDQSLKTLGRLAADTVLSESSTIRREQEQIHALIQVIQKGLLAVQPLLEQLLQDGNAGRREQRPGTDSQLTFESGVVPAALGEPGQALAGQFLGLTAYLQQITDDLKKDMESGESLPRRRQAEQWFPLLGSMAARAEANATLWTRFSQQDQSGQAPWARWLGLVEQDGNQDISLNCSPVLAANTLTEHLWSHCAGAVLTSATLSALGSFDLLKMRAGLPAHAVYHRIASPFRYAEAACLVIPRLDCDPSDSERHTQALITVLPTLLKRDEAALMLFSSRKQMRDVLDRLDSSWQDIILCQDDYQKSQLLAFHRQRIDRNEPSIIFGLASFAEGVDLPGKYCRHVLIAKIPFTVPNDPVESTLAHWLEQQGENPFMRLSVPEAALRLVQASGRLLRNETDTGTITLFDERIVSKRYGQAIMDSLPPFRRVIFPALETSGQVVEE
ncbi:MAG: ATP-dependent DNA helicase DinG [Pseudomonadales bacterium]|nr:ATP-dependent DNA helicase DinG [Pseudomonadales bacterium]